MKIGILTYHSYPNFGANLQALSTVGYLKQKDHDAIVINWLPETLEEKAKSKVPEQQRKAHQLFCESNFSMTEICRTIQDVESAIVTHGIDMIFMGSDALWNYTPQKRRRVFSYHRLRYIDLSVTLDHNYPNPFWGCFSSKLNDIPKVAFSVSSQNMPYHLVTGELKEEMGNSLLQFKHITVRDLWTKQLVEYFTGNQISPDITPDPVFSFNNNVPVHITKEEIMKKFNLPEKYILFSFLHPEFDNNWVNQFDNLCNENGILCVALTFPEKLLAFNLKSKIDQPLDTLDWYYLIKYSSGYVGERMHPIITSLHNIVPFFVFDDYGLSHGDRLKDLLYPVKPQRVLESSKIYDILQRADFLNNYYSYKVKEKLPVPLDVFECLLKFDKEKCILFSIKQQNMYNESMEKTLNYF